MTLARHQFTVTDAFGNVVPGAHVEVRREAPGTPLAAIFSDTAGVSGLGNPFDADGNGHASFCVAAGTYKIRVYTGLSGSPTSEQIWRDVPISLLASNNLSELEDKKLAKDTISLRGGDIASASTIDLDAATGDFVVVTGTTTINAITLAPGRERTVWFFHGLTLTHSSALIIPGGTLVVPAQSFAIFRGLQSGEVVMIGFLPSVGVQPKSAILTMLAGWLGSVNKLPHFGGAGNFALADLTPFARSILDDTSGAAMYATMGAAMSAASSGYWVAPNGLTIQWGTAPGGSDTTVTFPAAFANACRAVVAQVVGTAFANPAIGAPTTTSFVHRPRYSGGTATETSYWIAVGY